VEQTAVIKTYDRMAATYDLVFSPIFQPGRQRIIDKMNCQPGDRILEVGVGTGMSLSCYPRSTRITGIDVSPKMLERGHRRVRKQQLNHVDLRIMDAQQLEFADNSFDKVTAMYVASVVPDPRRMVAEMKRVCRPGGDLFIVNHFSHAHSMVRWFERGIAVITPLIGFTSDFPLDRFLADAQIKHFDIEPVNLFGYWSMIHARND